MQGNRVQDNTFEGAPSLNEVLLTFRINLYTLLKLSMREMSEEVLVDVTQSTSSVIASSSSETEVCSWWLPLPMDNSATRHLQNDDVGERSRSRPEGMAPHSDPRANQTKAGGKLGPVICRTRRPNQSSSTSSSVFIISTSLSHGRVTLDILHSMTRSTACAAGISTSSDFLHIQEHTLASTH